MAPPHSHRIDGRHKARTPSSSRTIEWSPGRGTASRPTLASYKRPPAPRSAPPLHTRAFVSLSPAPRALPTEIDRALQARVKSGARNLHTAPAYRTAPPPPEKSTARPTMSFISSPPAFAVAALAAAGTVAALWGVVGF
jgi:hypothetical protein